MLQALVRTLAVAALTFSTAQAQDAPSASQGQGLSDADAMRLQQVLDAQPEESQARYQWRRPAETLAFFGIKPGMTVVEVLPGGGWYSAILLPYLGAEGTLIGADYPLSLWPNFPFVTEEFMAKRRNWPRDWPATAEQWQGEDSARVAAVRIGGITDDLNLNAWRPVRSATGTARSGVLIDDLNGSADAVLFIRALHNLNAFEGKGGFRSMALANAWSVLKPGGLVGVVQHQAPEGRSDDWADGSRGYLNRDALVANFQAVGFELAGESDINRNPKDVPAEDEVVWRLPPSLNGSEDDPELRAKYQAIGESNRMTLLFRKPTG